MSLKVVVIDKIYYNRKSISVTTPNFDLVQIFLGGQYILGLALRGMPGGRVGRSHNPFFLLINSYVRIVPLSHI